MSQKRHDTHRDKNIICSGLTSITKAEFRYYFIKICRSWNFSFLKLHFNILFNVIIYFSLINMLTMSCCLIKFVNHLTVTQSCISTVRSQNQPHGCEPDFTAETQRHASFTCSHVPGKLSRHDTSWNRGELKHPKCKSTTPVKSDRKTLFTPSHTKIIYLYLCKAFYIQTPHLQTERSNINRLTGQSSKWDINEVIKSCLMSMTSQSSFTNDTIIQVFC